MIGYDCNCWRVQQKRSVDLVSNATNLAVDFTNTTIAIRISLEGGYSSGRGWVPETLIQRFDCEFSSRANFICKSIYHQTICGIRDFKGVCDRLRVEGAHQVWMTYSAARDIESLLGNDPVWHAIEEHGLDSGPWLRASIPFSHLKF